MYNKSVGTAKHSLIALLAFAPAIASADPATHPPSSQETATIAIESDGSDSYVGGVEKTTDGLILKTALKTLAGFRMEGPPEVDIVFGDSERFTERLEQFDTLVDRMKKKRSAFGTDAQATLQTLLQEKGCPSDKVLEQYRNCLLYTSPSPRDS